MRRKFFIKPKLQLKHLLWTIGMVVFCSLVGYGLFETMLQGILAPRLMGPLEWEEVRNLMRLGFGVILLLLSIAVGVENYFFFHSIVGPLVALEKGLKKVADGELNDEIKIRDTDQLHDAVEAFEGMKKSLRQRLSQSGSTHQ